MPDQLPAEKNLFSEILRVVATPLTAAFFLVTAITGLMILLHIGFPWVVAIHVGVAPYFILAASLHLFKNRNPLFNYFRRPFIWLALLLALTAALTIWISIPKK